MFKQTTRPPADFRVLKMRAAEDSNRDMNDYIKVRVASRSSPLEPTRGIEFFFCFWCSRSLPPIPSFSRATRVKCTRSGKTTRTK